MRVLAVIKKIAILLGIVCGVFLLLARHGWAQVPMTGAGKGTPAAAVTYTGPGDVFSGAVFWGSCARVYTAAQASTSTSLCDLVAVTGGATVCTLRGSATGFVDQSAYCGGSTPSAACAAASGGSCKVSKVYDQSGSGNDVTQGTLASMPALTFSSPASGSLPSLDCTGTVFLASAGTFSQAIPITFSAVQIRTTGTAAGGSLGGSNTNYIGSGPSANQALLTAGTFLTQTATDNTWYAINAFNTSASNSVVNVDGSEVTGIASSANLASNIRLCRASFTNIQGKIIEGGIWFLSSNSTNRNALNSNQHSANGYNF